MLLAKQACRFRGLMRQKNVLSRVIGNRSGSHAHDLIRCPTLMVDDGIGVTRWSDSADPLREDRGDDVSLDICPLDSVSWQCRLRRA